MQILTLIFLTIVYTCTKENPHIELLSFISTMKKLDKHTEIDNTNQSIIILLWIATACLFVCLSFIYW